MKPGMSPIHSLGSAGREPLGEKRHPPLRKFVDDGAAATVLLDERYPETAIDQVQHLQKSGGRGEVVDVIHC